MKRIQEYVLRLQVWRDTGGQGLVEYALSVGLVAVAAVAAMPTLSATVSTVFSKIGSIINNNVKYRAAPSMAGQARPACRICPVHSPPDSAESRVRGVYSGEHRAVYPGCHPGIHRSQPCSRLH